MRRCLEGLRERVEKAAARLIGEERLSGEAFRRLIGHPTPARRGKRDETEITA
ncbi:MAG: hypothetical protein GX161_05590 [Firmicutes bacterium]|nr:hypothetical protein [Bacillota bacterium]